MAPQALSNSDTMLNANKVRMDRPFWFPVLIYQVWHKLVKTGLKLMVNKSLPADRTSARDKLLQIYAGPLSDQYP